VFPYVREQHDLTSFCGEWMIIQTYLFLNSKMNQFLKVIMIAIFSVMLVSLFLQVTFRFFLNIPLSWSEELARYLTVWMIFLGASLGVRSNKLIRLDILLTKINERYHIYFLYASAVISSFFYVVIIVKSFDIIQIVHMQQSPAMTIPMSVPYLAIPVGSAFMLLNTIASLFEAHTKGGK
jgi:TRAP-type C4-dicarboxylate transport system permease small subunit